MLTERGLNGVASVLQKVNNVFQLNPKSTEIAENVYEGKSKSRRVRSDDEDKEKSKRDRIQDVYKKSRYHVDLFSVFEIWLQDQKKGD